MSKMTKNTSVSLKTRRLTTTGVMLGLATAIAFVCEFIPFLNLPFGGTITIASMVPVMILSYMYGIKWGFLSSFAYSVIQILMSVITGSTVKSLFTPTDESYMGIGIAFAVILIDYIIAYTALGAAGLFRSRLKSKTAAIAAGIAVALSLCYLAHIISGYIFYGVWAEWFFETVGMEWVLETFTGGLLKWLYTIVYNGCYMIPEIIISVSAGIAVSRIPQVRKADAA